MYNSIKRNKILRNKFNQGGEISVHWKLQDIDERNWRTHKWMGKYSIFMDQKN